MSHFTGVVITLGSPVGIGPAFGSLTHNFSPAPAPAPVIPPGGIKFVILHFTGASFPGNNRLEVDLGYDMDVFRAADGTDFWTRPINVNALAGVAPIRYIVDGGGGAGGVQLVGYGRGQRNEGEGLAGHEYSYSNCDPFLTSGNYTEPDYDEFWYCHNPPNTPPDWENVACLPGGDIRKNVARATCMIVGAHGTHLSTCTGTLIGTDTIITAAHCQDNLEETKTMSVIFNYETNCDGSKPAGYNAKFYKVIRALNHGTIGIGATTDYIILQLKVPPGGLGITPIPMRTSFPAPGEQVFGIHHPNGAVKKVSKKHSLGYAVVKPYTTGYIKVDTIDVSGGSSGSGLFDTTGKFLGVLSNGVACDLGYAPSKTILDHIAAGPLPSPVRDVFIVFDRSGSMGMDAGTDGDTKMIEAKDAANLFVDLVKAGAGHRIGLVSFSTTAVLDRSLTVINNSFDRQQVKGPPNGIAALATGGNTSIGHGLQIAASNFPAPGVGVNKRTILLLTDGLQNTMPMINDALGSLGTTDISAIGFGTESSLNGAILTTLAGTHNGLYMRAGDGLNLRKFFALSFGNIFESGALLDPEYVLPAAQMEAKPIEYNICEETTVTIILGWDKFNTPLFFRLETPSGKNVDFASNDIESSQGRKWRFIRMKLPHSGEQNGTWKIKVHRQPAHGEFPPEPLAARFFVNVIAKDGPFIKQLTQNKKYHTGDTINPLVGIFKPDGFAPENAKITLAIQKPKESIGNILSRTGIKDIAETDGDTVPARYRVMQQIEAGTKKPLIDYGDETIELFDDAMHDDGSLEPDGVFGNPLKDLLQHEGNYTFRAVATYGDGCTGTREITWTIHVENGIDPGRTGIQTTVTGTLAGGKQQVKIIFTPMDKYGNKTGPGRLDAFTVTGTTGTQITGTVTDMNNGDYQVYGVYDPASGNSPGIIIGQEDRPPVTITPSGSNHAINDCKKWKQWFWIFFVLFLLALAALVYCLVN